MVAPPPVCRHGLATVRFYTAFHDLAHSRSCTRHRSISSLSISPRNTANAFQCPRQRSPRSVPLLNGSRRAHTATRPVQHALSKTTAKLTLSESDLRKFRDLDIRDGLSLHSPDPCTVRLEETSSDGIVHISGSEEAVSKALEYIRLELATSLNGSPSGHELPTTPELYEPYKSMMRSVVSPVAVITAVNIHERSARHDTEYSDCVGATISSLCSVCVKPTPVVSFNLHRESGTAKAILRSNSVIIHILTADQSGEAIARAFSDPSKSHHSDPFRAVAALPDHQVEVTAGQESGNRAALLSGPGVLARAHCRHLGDKVVDIGDHLVLFARLMKTEQTASGARDLQGVTGLSFGQSRYLQSQVLENTTFEPPLSNTRKRFKPSPRKSHSANSASDTHTKHSILDEIAHFKAPELPDPAVLYEPDQPSDDHQATKTTESSSASISDSKGKSFTSDAHTRRFSTLGLDRQEPANAQSTKRTPLTFPPAPAVSSWRPSKGSTAPRFFTPSTTRRAFSTTSSSPAQEKKSKSRSADAEPAPSTPQPSPTFLRQTVAEYLNIASMPNHRWRNERTLAELKGYGLERVHLAIRGGTADAEPGSLPGQRTNSLDVRIRLLIERLHSANKLGHVADGVMEELLVGPSEEGKAGKEDGA